MKRREVPHGTLYLTFSCEHRLPLFRNPAICDLFAERLEEARQKHQLLIHAWVIMPEHLHLVVKPGGGLPVGPALRSLKTSFAKSVVRRWRALQAPILKRITDESGTAHFFLPGGGFDRNVRSVSELSREIPYIHMNPVRRGLVASPELWRWSSVHWWLGKRDGGVHCAYPLSDRDWESWKGFVDPDAKPDWWYERRGEEPPR